MSKQEWPNEKDKCVECGIIVGEEKLIGGMCYSCYRHEQKQWHQRYVAGGKPEDL